MPVKGLLITLDEDSQKAASAVEEMSARPDIEVGELNEKWLPVVVESSDEYESKQAVKWIEALPGVYFIDTVFSSVDGDDPTAEAFKQNPKTEKIS